jgi:hypothetical protein
MTSWDDPNAWGREHRRLARSAFKHAEKAAKLGAVESASAWSVVYARHSKEALALMQFKRLMELDLDGVHRPSISREEKAALQSR